MKIYKPFTHQWAYDAWKKQQTMHWLVSEISLVSSLKDWNEKLSDNDRRIIIDTFRFFVQADIEVSDNYEEYLHNIRKTMPAEISMMLASFQNTETIHIDAYSNLIDSLGLPDTEYGMFAKLRHTLDKYNHLSELRRATGTASNIISLAVSGVLIEGVQLFSTFAVLLSYSKKMKVMQGMGQIIAYSIRDEELHTSSMARLYNLLIRDYKGDIGLIENVITRHATKIKDLEIAFLDVLFDGKQAINGIKKENLIRYIDYLIHKRLKTINIHNPDLFPAKSNPFIWIEEITDLQEDTKHFDIKGTDYAKGSMTGSFF